MKLVDWNALNSCEQLTTIGNVLRNTRTDCLTEFALEDVVAIVTSCILSDWDVTPCDLTTEEIGYAKHGRVKFLNRALAKRLG